MNFMTELDLVVSKSHLGFSTFSDRQTRSSAAVLAATIYRPTASSLSDISLH